MTDTTEPTTTGDPRPDSSAAGSDQHLQYRIEDYTTALTSTNLAINKQIDLLNLRAKAYGKLQEFAAQISDLEAANRLLGDQVISERQAVSERDTELVLLNTVAEALNTQQDVQEIYDHVGDQIRSIFSARTVLISIYDFEDKLALTPYLYENGTRVNVQSRPLHLDLANSKNDHLPLRFDTAEQMLEFGLGQLKGTEAMESYIGVPLLAGDKLIGRVSLQDERPFMYNEKDLRLLDTLANSMSIALENARLFAEMQHLLEEAEQRNAELAVINSVQQGLAEQVDIQGIYDLVGEKVQEIFSAQGVMIIIHDPEHDIIRTPYLFEMGERYYLPDRPISDRIRKLNYSYEPLLFNTVDEWQAGGLHQIEGTAVMQSYLGVPLVLGETIMGAINLQDERPYHFDESDIRLLTTLANSMSIALENARLFDETQNLLRESQQRNAELAVINSVQQGLASKLELKGIYELVGERIRDIFDAQAVMIATYDHSQGLVYLKYLYEKGERFVFSGGQPFNKLSRHLISSRQTMVINRDAAEVGAEFEMGIPAGEHPLSMVFVPLITSDIVSGFISLQDIDHEEAFTETDVRLLETLAASMSVALENARLFGVTKRWAKENSALAAVGRDISSTLDLPKVLERIARHARELLDASDCAVFLPDDEGQTMNAFVALGTIAAEVKATTVQPGVGILGDIWQKAEAEMINNASSDPRAVRIAGTEEQPDEKMMIAPLLSGDNVSGLMAVWRAEGDPFRETNLDFLVGLARQAAIAIENARLFTIAESARAAAEEANRSKSAFLANVSHELRTPLTSILGFAHVLQSRLDRRIVPVIPPDDRRAQRAIQQIDESLNIILSEGERLTSLINNVLDLEKIEAGRMDWHMESLDIGDVVSQAIEASNSLIEQKRLELVKIVPDKLSLIVGDRDKLVQVVINLLANAVKFTDNGTITCSIEAVSDALRVNISDTGVGIAAQDLEDVFAKFRQVGDTLTEKPRGTGLGLPISKEIIEHHGGRIWIESKLGEGSTISFTLPVAPSGQPDAVHRLSMDELLAKLKKRIADVPSEHSNGSKRILVADDNEAIRKLLSQELAAEGYEVYEAADGRSALDQVKTRQLDLVILDVLMPELSGFDVAAVIKNDPQTVGLPIVIVSVLEDKGRGFQLGVDRYLTKPIAMPALLHEVQVLLEQGTSRRKVLIIDEDAKTVETLSAALRVQGFSVTAVTSGLEGVHAAIESHPDMIVANAELSEAHNLVQAIRFEKGLQNVLFLLFQ